MAQAFVYAFGACAPRFGRLHPKTPVQSSVQASLLNLKSPQNY